MTESPVRWLTDPAAPPCADCAQNAGADPRPGGERSPQGWRIRPPIRAAAASSHPPAGRPPGCEHRRSPRRRRPPGDPQPRLADRPRRRPLPAAHVAAGDRRLLHRLPLVRLAQLRRRLHRRPAVEGAPRRPLHRRPLRGAVGEPPDRRPHRPPLPPGRSGGGAGRALPRAHRRAHRPRAPPHLGAVRPHPRHRRLGPMGQVDPLPQRPRRGPGGPQFKTDVGFYLFRLPFLSFLVDWAFAAVVVVLLVTAVAHYLNGGIRVQGRDSGSPPGEGPSLGPPRRPRPHQGRRLLAAALRAELLDPGRSTGPPTPTSTPSSQFSTC